MSTFLERFASRLRREPATVAIAADGEGVVATLRNGEHSVSSFSWPDVQEIQTFKRDLLTFDEICLPVRASDLW
jgi:hypothetical protein